jgi:hypothetical protein
MALAAGCTPHQVEAQGRHPGRIVCHSRITESVPRQGTGVIRNRPLQPQPGGLSVVCRGSNHIPLDTNGDLPTEDMFRRLRHRHLRLPSAPARGKGAGLISSLWFLSLS